MCQSWPKFVPFRECREREEMFPRLHDVPHVPREKLLKDEDDRKCVSVCCACVRVQSTWNANSEIDFVCTRINVLCRVYAAHTTTQTMERYGKWKISILLHEKYDKRKNLFFVQSCWWIVAVPAFMVPTKILNIWIWFSWSRETVAYVTQIKRNTFGIRYIFFSFLYINNNLWTNKK